MKNNPFKGFQTHACTPGFLYLKLMMGAATPELQADIQKFESEDPVGAFWGTIGFVSPDGSGQFAVPLEGTRSVLLAVQFNDRILPGKVRDEHMKQRIADLMDREGRTPTKREFAQLRDDAEAELLPKSHIRRSVVPLLVYHDHIVIFTTSHKRGLDIVTLLFRLSNALGKDIRILPAATNDFVAQWLTAIATADDDSCLAAMDSAVHKSANPETNTTVRIKDKDLGEGDVQDMLRSGEYRAAELGVCVIDGWRSAGVEGVTFTLTEKLIVKGMKFSDLSIRAAVGEIDKRNTTAASAAEFLGMATLVALSVSTILTIVFDALGGEDRKAFDLEEDDGAQSPEPDEDDDDSPFDVEEDDEL